MSKDSIGAIGSSKSKGAGYTNNNSQVSFNREEWLQKQWKQGKTIFTVPHAGGGFIQ